MGRAVKIGFVWLLQKCLCSGVIVYSNALANAT